MPSTDLAAASSGTPRLADSAFASPRVLEEGRASPDPPSFAPLTRSLNVLPRIPTVPFLLTIPLVMAVLVAGCGGTEERSTSSVETQPTAPRVSSSRKSEPQTKAKRHPTLARDSYEKPISESEHKQQARAGRNSPQGEKPTTHAAGHGEAESSTDLGGGHPIRVKPTHPTPGTDTYGESSQGSPPPEPEAGTDAANMSR
jgi:hypothetical protein